MLMIGIENWTNLFSGVRLNENVFIGEIIESLEKCWYHIKDA